ncbi:hypothetical protein cypCar_00043147, partial [Cyprinus carpio]
MKVKKWFIISDINRKEFASLTDEEVDQAIQRSGSTEEPLTVAVPGPAHIAHPVPLAPYSPSGYRWRDYTALAVILAGMAFGFHHLYRV